MKLLLQKTLRGFMALVLLLSFLESTAQTNVVVTGGTTVNCPAVPVATWTTPPAGVTFSNWSRGSGVSCTSANNGLSGSGFNASSASAGISANAYYSVTLAADAFTNFTLNSLVWITQLSGSTNSCKFTVKYSNNGGANTDFGTTAQSINSSGSQTSFTFTAASAVTVAAGTSITIYLIPHQATALGTTVRWVNASSINVTASSATIAPTVTTNFTPSLIAATAATLGGNVTADGGSAVTARGIVYSLTSTNSTPSLSGTGVTNLSASGTTGTFAAATTTALNVNEQYSYRAYATNTIGTNYGDAVVFYTLANVPNAPVVNTNPALGSLDVTIDNNAQNGNSSSTQYAIRINGGNFVQANGTVAATAVWQTAAIWGTKTVSGLNDNTSYAFDIKARNGSNVETGYSTSASGTTIVNTSPDININSPLTGFGNICVNSTLERSFTFSGTSLNGTDLVIVALSGFSYSTDQINYSASLNIAYSGNSISNKIVYVRFSPIAVQSYNGSIVITGGGLLAPYFSIATTGSGINTAVSVSNGAVTSITSTSAIIAGTFTQGCSNINAYGIEYSLTNNFTSGTVIAASNAVSGSFSVSLSNLLPNTTYYFRAYATDATGTVKATPQSSFTTNGITEPIATAATSIQQTAFTANWEAVSGATSYKLDVSTSPTFTGMVSAPDLIITEYVEGSGNNKYIEIYNGTNAAVDLSAYLLAQYNNGSSSITTTLPLTGTLAVGDTYVVRNSSANIWTGTSDLSNNTVMGFNGDDVIALRKSNVTIDIVGTVPASGNFAADVTLRRKATVLAPTSTYNANQWDSFAQNTVSDLGMHTFNNVGPSFVPGYQNLTVNGLSQSVSGLATFTDYYYRVRAVSLNSTSGNSNVISVKTLAAPPTFGTIMQNAAVCENETAQFNITGLLQNSVSTINYNIDGVSGSFIGIATVDGNATVNIALNLANNGQTLTVTSIERTDQSGGIVIISTTNTVVLSVNQNVTYYLDSDNDGFGNPAASSVSCLGAPINYVSNNTDCDDTNTAIYQNGLFYVDVDGDGYTVGNQVTVCYGATTPTGYSVTSLGTDCNDSNAAVNPGAAEIGYNLIDDDCDGSIDEGFPPIVTVPQGCNNTLAAIDSYIYANLVAGAQGYRWRVTTMSGPSAGQIQFLDTPLRAMRITQLVNYAFATAYKIEVGVYYAGFLQPYTATSCSISTPATPTQLIRCSGDTRITAMTDIIYANNIPFAAGYRFKITDPANPSNTQELFRATREFRMSLITNFSVLYNKVYNVQVSIRNTDGTYLPYLNTCEVTTPIFPTVGLQDSQCDTYAVPSNNTIIYADSYPGVIRYVFRLKGAGLPAAGVEVTKNLRTFTLSDFPTLQGGATYNVQVRLVFNLSDAAGSYGKTCSIVAPGSARAEVSAVKGVFSAVAYPNPFSENFSISLTTPRTEEVSVKVYDMTGRLLQALTTEASEMKSLQVGDNFPSGVYNIIVNQGTETRTLRVVKR